MPTKTISFATTSGSRGTPSSIGGRGSFDTSDDYDDAASSSYDGSQQIRSIRHVRNRVSDNNDQVKKDVEIFGTKKRIRPLFKDLDFSLPFDGPSIFLVV